MPTANVLIWLSAKPLLKLVITTSCGYILTKMELFGAVAAKGASQLLLNVFLPALLFSKITPGFTAQNIAALGLLVLVACIYQLYGLLIAWIVRKIFWVPRQFRNGILVAGACNNWGDLPTAVIMTITASMPFSSGDSDVAVAYISIFILIGFAALFPLGGHRLIARDFADVNTPADVDDIPQSAISRVCSCWSSRRVPHETTPDADLEKAGCQFTIGEKGSNVPLHNPQSPAKNICSSHREVPTDRTEHPKRDSSNSTDPGDGTVVSNLPILNKTPSLTSSNETPSPIEPRDSRFRRATASTWRFLVALATPPTISIVVGITVAMIPTLKALFVPSPSDSHPHIGTAPDGLPPLHVIFDTATFIGGGSIPLGLICLGSALARLEVPKPFSRAPLGAIAALSILKMVIGPVFGVLIVEALTHRTALIDPNDKVLRFVCMYLAGSPTATTQVYLTQIYSPDGSASHVSSFLIPQYALMLVTMTALSAYALNILF